MKARGDAAASKRSDSSPTLNNREKCRDESRGIFLFCVNNPAPIGVECCGSGERLCTVPNAAPNLHQTSSFADPAALI